MAEVVVADAEGICPLAAEGPDVKRLSTLCLVALVALAGCTGGGGGGTPTETGTLDDAPPGVSASGVDADALVAAHEDALADRSYTLAVDQQTTGGELTIDAKTDSDGLPAIIELSTGSADRETYLTANGSYEIRRGGGEQIVRHVDTDASAVPTGGPYVRDVLDDAQFTYDGTVQRDGRTLHRLSADQADLQRQFQNATVTSYEAELLVSSDGLVHNTTYQLTLAENGTEETFTTRIQLTDVGSTTVAEPAWLGLVSDDPETTTRQVQNASLGTSVTVSGELDNVTAVSVSNASDLFYQSSVVEPSRVSPIVAMQTNRSVSVDSVEMEYDLEAVPDAEASGLFVFAYRPAYGSLLPMETSFDPTNETVRATQFDPDITLNTTDGEQFSPTLDGLRGNVVFVTMDAQTYREALEEANEQQASDQSN